MALCERRDVDIVAIVLPPGLYPPIVEAAAQAGKAILLEKPLAATPDAARRILRAVRQAHVPAMVAHTLRFDSRVQALLREVRKLGPVRTLHYVHQLPNRGLRWESEATHGPGGILHQTATHGLDLIRFITGREARRVSCLAWRAHNPRLADAALIRVELASRASATVSVGKVSTGLSQAIEAVCDGGIVRADLVTGRLTVSWGGSGTRRARQREWVVPATPTVPLAVGAFTRAVRAGRAAPVPLADAAQTHALVEAALTSARRGGGAVVPVRLA
jgi:myo-inositol 2-dehydrogenase/D-chiro-inositol 1-dehydrogenase